MDYIPPRVKLSDDTFIFLDGKWVNETYIQSALSSSMEARQKHSSKKMHNDWTLWEENKALWEENKALRVENRVLREENKALQALRMENKGIQVIYDESLQQILQKENKPLAALPIIELQDDMGGKALQVFREEKKALQIFREKNMALKVFPEEKKSTQFLQKEKQSAQLLAKEDTPAQEASKIVAQDTSNKPALAEAIEAIQEIQEESRTLPVQERNKTLFPLKESETLEAVQKLNETVLLLLRENRALLEQKEDLQTIQGGNKILWEENKKLKLQQNAIKGAVCKIITQMDLLHEELNSFASVEESENVLKKPESC
ncbi:protein chibby homolog 2 [Rhineura floridana]|uniref:protein chibby homolog 2 n=1 Tax=Rhineura floridana TaxID=261503 RepID=UPI002AC84962|nr:protein chibby homolog 2 [Rhineura floridana]XP_061490715.1 protein chibby homolog 2 [Rhineura floridana]XP_061490716.1 protein chibby homolog 2 [Rhineura floridana]XP_061490717.1 protein chibby homolog 2 [Rhineura floridana]XP_061490718.1 protein chibby homolog 2 [Rhineura floridana]XP_061490719.1 protein chibby homolog 2 [Rhineura floridana]XP_061490720.1 protein chibby homolog 2 [Rhineura floridana]